MKSVLFVDDEPNILEGLKVMLHSVRGEWDITFAASAKEGMQLIQEGREFQVIVSDLQMPEMQGDKFLKLVTEHRPQAVRFVLSGRLDTPNLARAGVVAHQILGKPCDPHHLRARLTRAIALRNQLTECPLRDDLFRMCGIPSVPLVFWELQNEIAQKNPSIDRISTIIERDPSMGAKVLQVAHAAYSSGERVSGIADAVRVIGLDNIRSFVLMAGIFEQANPEDLPKGIDLEILWQHAMKVADYAKRIAACDTEDKNRLDEAYTAGLLHDIGLLIIATKMTAKFTDALQLRQEKNISLYRAEKEIFGTSHAEIGGFLLDLWGLPESIVQAIAYHLYPSAVPEKSYEMAGPGEDTFSSLTAVHVANYLCEDQDSMIENGAKAEVDSIHLEETQLSNRLEDWYDACYAT